MTDEEHEVNGLAYIYAGAIFFSGLGLQVVYLILLYRTELGSKTLPDPREYWQNMSFVRALFWPPAVMMFWVGSVLLLKRSKKSMAYLGLGSALYLAGNAWDEYFTNEAIGSAGLTLYWATAILLWLSFGIWYVWREVLT
jgi:hypothetical protein